MSKYRLLLSTGMHFCVDGICAAALMAGSHGKLTYEQIVLCFCIYNLIAFGTQFVAGYVLDKKPAFLRQSLLLSCLLLALGTLTVLGLQLQVIFLGLGNCLFHVTLGSLILRSTSSCKQLGIFVSSGAVGLGLGLAELVGAMVFLVFYLLQVWLFLSAQGLSQSSKELALANDSKALQAYNATSKGDSQAAPNTARDAALNDATKPSRLTLTLVAILLLLCVVVRGFGGSNNDSDYLMLFPCTFALGKILGGVAADSLGYRRTIVLIFALSFLALQWEGLGPTILLVLSFNMTMPLTLRLLHFCNPGMPGLMFGLAAGCLLPGFFFVGTFSPDLRVMAVAQFLILFVAGYYVRSNTGERVLQLPKPSL